MGRPCVDLLGHTETGQVPGCRPCELYHTRDDYRRLWDGPHPPCQYRGPSLTGFQRQALGLTHAQEWVACNHPAQPLGPVVCPCQGCGSGCSGYTVDAPTRVVRINGDGLPLGGSGIAFNGSIIRYRGKLLLAYRTDWAGAQVHVVTLNPETFQPNPATAVTLRLRHDRASFGREDPRLFIFRDRLHVAYIGVEPGGASVLTNQMYARLKDDFQVEEIFYPNYPGRAEWEKNWQFFEYADDLYAVYSIAPHRVLHIRGNEARLVHETPTPFAWAGGHLRGGAPPVRVGQRFYHWFHGRTDHDWRYNYGLYTFAADPPFPILSMTPEPLLWAGPETDGNYCPVHFPAGAVHDGGKWLLSLGVNDRRVEIHEWKEPLPMTPPKNHV
jgi:predicted GH43/DUF377 family glycosyl hydrolase